MSLIDFSEYLLVGQRIDLSKDLFIDFTQYNWKQHLCQIVQEGKATLHSPAGIDYFAFKRGMFRNLPPIIIGRAGYDNAIIAYCLRNHIPIVDGTFDVIALHQYHDYSHVQCGEKGVMQGSDAIYNLHQAGGMRSRTMVSDANYMLKNSQIIHWPCRGDRLRCLELKIRYEMGSKKLWLMFRLIWRVLQTMGITGIKQLSLSEVLKDKRH